MSTKTKRNKHGRKGVKRAKHTQAVAQPNPVQRLEGSAEVIKELTTQRDLQQARANGLQDALEQVVEVCATARTGSGKVARDIAKVALGTSWGVSS